MIAISNLDSRKVANDLVNRKDIWTCEGENRTYVKKDDVLAVMHGKYGVSMTMDEWAVVLKLFNDEVLKTVKGLIADFRDYERMGVEVGRVHYRKREKSTI